MRNRWLLGVLMLGSIRVYVFFCLSSVYVIFFNMSIFTCCMFVSMYRKNSKNWDT